MSSPMSGSTSVGALRAVGLAVDASVYSGSACFRVCDDGVDEAGARKRTKTRCA